MNISNIYPYREEYCWWDYVGSWAPVLTKAVAPLSSNRALITWVASAQDPTWYPECVVPLGTYKVMAVLAMINGNDITYSPPVELYDASLVMGGFFRFGTTVTALSESIAVVAFHTDQGPHTIETIVVEVGINTITAHGSPVTVVSGISGGQGDVSIAKISETEFVVVCANFPTSTSTDRGIFAILGTVVFVGLSAWYMSPVRINSDIVDLDRGTNDGWSGNLSCEHIGGDDYAVIYHTHPAPTFTGDDYLYLTVMEIIGGTVTPRDSYEIVEYEDVIEHSRMSKIDTNKVLVTWSTKISFNKQQLLAKVITIADGEVDTAGTTQILLNDASDVIYHNSAVANPSKFVHFYSYVGETSYEVRGQEGTINGTTLSLDSVVTVGGSEGLWAGLDVRFLTASRFIVIVDDFDTGGGFSEDPDIGVSTAFTGRVSGGVYALSHAIDKKTGDLCYVTTHSSDILRLNICDLTTQSIVKVMAFGAATSEQVQNKTRILYPYHSFDGYLYLFGNFTNPDTSSVAHILRTNDLGVTLEIVENSWGTDSCSGFVKGSSRMVAARSIVGGTEIYSGTHSLVKVSTLPFIGHIDKRSMKIQYTDNRVVIGANTGQSVMILQAFPPYTRWSNITLNHGTANGINSLDIIY